MILSVSPPKDQAPKYVPKVEDVMAGFELGCDPTDVACRDEVKNGMAHLLSIAIPAVEPKVKDKRKWRGSCSTHLSFFGDNAWPFEMALGMVLIQYFSDTKNIEHNNSHDKSAPKKRARLMKKSNEEEICDSYYTYCREFKQIMKQEGFVARMELWDHYALNGIRKVGEDMFTPISNITNIVPRSLRSEEGGADLMDGFDFFPQCTPV